MNETTEQAAKISQRRVDLVALTAAALCAEEARRLLRRTYSALPEAARALKLLCAYLMTIETDVHDDAAWDRTITPHAASIMADTMNVMHLLYIGEAKVAVEKVEAIADRCNEYHAMISKQIDIMQG